MKFIKITTHIILLAFFSCKPTVETSTTNVNASNLALESGIIYALPKTNLKFTIQAIRTDIVPGPYYEYAEKYMGIENVPEKETTRWHISDVSIEAYNDIDPGQFYILEPSGKMNISLNKLIDNGSILPVNDLNTISSTNEFYGKHHTEDEIVFTDLSVTKYIGEEEITYYKRVQRDSLLAKIPVVKKQTVYKSFDDKAEEAANFIFLIREKRFELLTGMADFYPEGKSLEIAIDELNRLEKDYLELFTGKKFTSTYSASFDFSPTETELSQPYILFRFNEERGILSPDNLGGRPIIVELKSKEVTKNLSFLMSDRINRGGVEYKNKLYYRMPDIVEIEVFDGKTILAKGKANMAQFGVVVNFPSMFLMDDEKFIEFYRDKE